MTRSARTWPSASGSSRTASSPQTSTTACCTPRSSRTHSTARDPSDRPPDADYSFVDDDRDFEQRVHTLSAGINLRILENLNCRVEGYHIRSKSEFTPGFRESFYGPNITDPRELKDISEVDIRQNGIKSRITWQFTRMLRAQFEYTYDDYDDQNSDVFDGSAQTFIASLGGSF